MITIYKITNKNNNLSYIGSTSQSLKRRVKYHFNPPNKRSSLLQEAIKIYGKDNFSVEILEITKEEYRDTREVYYINYYNTITPLGYNSQSGGLQNYKLHKKTKNKISQAVREWYKTNTHPYLNKKFSIDHKIALSKSRKGKQSLKQKEAFKKSTRKFKNTNNCKKYKN